MDALPLHAGLVHLPIGLAFLLPLLALGVGFAIWRTWLPRAAWVLVVLVAALTLATGVAARQTGEEDEDRVEKVVPHAALEAHEEAASAFLGVLGAFTGLAAAVLFLRKDTPFRLGLGALSLLAFGVLGAALYTGRLGGEIVYQHRACTVGGTLAAPAGTPAPGEPRDDD